MLQFVIFASSYICAFDSKKFASNGLKFSYLFQSSGHNHQETTLCKICFINVYVPHEEDDSQLDSFTIQNLSSRCKNKKFTHNRPTFDKL